MFERFKRNRPAGESTDDRRTAVAERPVAARSAADDRPADDADDRTAVREPGEDRHTGRKVAAGAGAGVVAGEVAGRHHERERERERDLPRDEGPVGTAPATTRTNQSSPVLEAEGLATMRARQRDRFGGISWGAAFFGWLSAIGLAAILTSLLAAAGAAIGLNQVKNAANNSTDTISLAGGILLLIVLAIAWYCGGYVAGRMARFDGARQGVAVWLWSIIFAALVAVAAIIGGSQYDIASKLNLPSVPTNNQTLTTGGYIAAGAALLVTLIFAMIGGKVGDRFHRRIDRVATERYETDAV